MEKKKYKVKLTVSFEYEAVVEATERDFAEGPACDMAMDYLDITLADSRKFDEFWEYQVETKVNSIEEI
jgi:hypothetical protein